MKLPSAKGNYELAPEGTHRAICCEIIDLGTQANSYKGQAKTPVRKVRFAWGLLDENRADGSMFLVGQDYPYIMGPKANFQKMLLSWIPKKAIDAAGGVEKFDIKNLINKGALISVIHNETAENTYANLGTISAFVQGMEKAVPLSSEETLYFSMDPDEFAADREGMEDAFERIPEWLQAKIKASPEWQQLHAPPPPKHANGSAAMIAANVVHTDNFDDEIPF